ncbi:IAH1 (predicted) [Pycnogonum litorale]
MSALLPPNTNDVRQWPQVILFGDSLIQYSFDPDRGCWGALIADRLRRRCDVINRGLSGYTSETALLSLPRLFSEENFNRDCVQAFVILLGTNDSLVHVNSQEERPFLTTKQYETNLISIIDKMTKLGLSRDKMILITPPPSSRNDSIDYYTTEGRADIYTTVNIKGYAQRCAKVGQKLKLEVIDINKELTKLPDWRSCLYDGIHFNRKGADFVFAKLWPSIERRIQQLPFALPHYSQLFAADDPVTVFAETDKNDNFV